MRIPLLLLCLLVTLMATWPAHAGQGVERFERADFVASDAVDPPPDDADWHPQPLPRRQEGPGWYRVRFTLADKPDDSHSVFLPRLRADATIYVNGVEIGKTSGGAPLRLNIRPELRTAPRSVLHAGINTLHLRADTKVGATRMSDIEWGPTAQVLEREATVRFWRFTAPTMAMAVQAFVAFITLLLWARRPREAVYGCFGLALVSFLPFAGLSLMPSDTPFWLAIGLGWSLYVFTPWMFLFALRYGGWRWPRAERAMWACAGATVLADLGSIVSSGPLRELLDVMAEGLSFALAAPYCAVLIAVALRRRSFESGLVAGAATTAVSWSAFTYYAHPADALSWVPFGNVPLYLIVTWALVLRFARSLDEAERLGVELADRVEAKRVELEANYGRFAELETQQAVMAERARLMSDMHDGIGGQLISTLSLVEGGEASKEQVCAALRECIDDLRLVIDSLEPIDNELLPVLGNLRYRLQPRLEAQGIELDWLVRDVPKLECLTPQNVLHVLRILQEALTNVVKHAGARRIRVETRAEGERVAIAISDDGSGFADRNAPRGRGLESIRMRADALGADLAVHTSPSGTMVTLVLPAR